jgi:hypothetical protein
MALKTDRIHIDSQIDYFMNEVAERGGIVCISTVGSGSAMDQAKQLATYPANVSGVKPLGVLMGDMVDIDLTRQHENWHKEEVVKGGKVTIWSKCTVVTDRIYPGVSPAAGEVAYVAPSGYISNKIHYLPWWSWTRNQILASGTHDVNVQIPPDFYDLAVGRFLSTKDENGFAKVSVNLP